MSDTHRCENHLMFNISVDFSLTREERLVVRECTNESDGNLTVVIPEAVFSVSEIPNSPESLSHCHETYVDLHVFH